MTHLLLTLADAGLLRPVWSQRIGHEWRHNAVRVWRQPADVLQQVWDDMQRRFPHADAGDITPYEAGLRYSDSKDWHVIAAARADQVRCPDAEHLIATWNLKDFNRSELRRLGLAALSPDALLLRCAQQNALLVQEAIQLAEAHAAASAQHVRTQHDPLKRERLFMLARWLDRQACAANV